MYAWLRQYVSDQSASIEMPAVMALEQIGGVNLRALAAEVDKVLVYIAPRTDIQEADIYAVCSAASASLFRFQEALKTRQVPMIFSSLTQLLAHSEDAIRLMALVAASFRLYFQVLVLDRDRVPVQKMGPQLGKNPYYLKRILADVKRAYSVEELRACFGILSTYDIKIKTGQMKPDQALTVALTRCVA
ncbi:MAG: hypothetical protein CL521_05520 [Actinobacteria bacterium]|nr:hypothetical protein [Actinomycetota bacterium]